MPTHKARMWANDQKELEDFKGFSKTTPFKQMITDIFILKDDMVTVYDQNNEQMPFFQGKRQDVMLKIKNRLGRQKGIVTWHNKSPRFKPMGTSVFDYSKGKDKKKKKRKKKK